MGKINLFSCVLFYVQYASHGKPLNQIQGKYDVIVVGSGYGGAVVASRAARAGQKVCILEKGREWLPGDFPETMDEAVKEMCLTKYEEHKMIGLYTMFK